MCSLAQLHELLVVLVRKRDFLRTCLLVKLEIVMLLLRLGCLPDLLNLVIELHLADIHSVHVLITKVLVKLMLLVLNSLGIWKTFRDPDRCSRRLCWNL